MINTRPRISLTDTFNFQEAADLLGVSRRTIYRWRQMGYIKVTKPRRVNRREYILGKELLKVYDAYC